ncbi:hypothetical protein E4T39_02342 [Aureobasidium subglaciale]|nr:hypothetical protein E4T39_02342 [Aureobasidium subglaciale]
MTPLENMLGNEKCADIWLVCSDGLLIPFHTVIFDLRNTLDSPFDVFIKSARVADEDLISVPLDGQTMWRILSFVYLDTYNDEATSCFSFRTVEAPKFGEEDELAVTFCSLQLDPQACKSATLLNAWSSMQVYVAANFWFMDRLVVESSERFGGFVCGSSAEEDFLDFVNAIFKAVPDRRQLLCDQIVKECVTNIHTLINNVRFCSIVGDNCLLGLLLVKELTALLLTCRKTPANGGQTLSAPMTSASTSVDASRVAELQNRLVENENQLLAEEKSVSRFEEENTNLRATVAHLLTENSLLKARLEISQPNDSVLVDQVTDKMDIIDNLAEQLDDKDQEMAEMRQEMFEKDQKISGLSRLNQDLIKGINSNRSGQRYITDLMIEHNKSREQVTALQALLKASEVKHEELLALTAAHAQALEEVVVNKARVPQPAAGKDSQPANTSQSADTAQGADDQRVIGFGVMTAAVNSITSGDAVPVETPIATATQPLPDPAITAQVASGGGPLTFPQRLAQRRAADMATRAQRQAAAGLNGGEAAEVSEGPTGMPLVSRGALPAAQQPGLAASNGASVNGDNHPPTINGAPRGPHAAAAAARRAGPHSRNVRSASVVSAGSIVNAVPLTQSERDTPTAARTPTIPQMRGGPHTTGAAPPRINGAQNAPTNATAGPAAAIIINGHTNGNPVHDALVRQQQSEVNRLQAEIAFLRRQLNDARTGKLIPQACFSPVLTIPGPAANVQTRDQSGRGGGGGGGGRNPEPRLNAILMALKEYDLDHKSCNDCGINFNSEWRGVVDNPREPSLILRCRKCGEEKCRWRC